MLDGEYMTDPSMLGPTRYDRHEHDLYETPDWCTEALLDHWMPRGTVWEPACGDGAIVRVLVNRGRKVIASDIKPGISSASTTDFLTHNSPGDGLLSIVTNPPYRYAERFVRKALCLTERSGGDVCMLLRHEWDCAASRKDLFTEKPFAMKVVLTKRPRWIADSTGSPRHNFGWFVWSWTHNGPAELRYS